MDHRALEGVERILVIAWGILGDSVCKLPAIAALRALFPQAEIVVWADAGMAEVFEGHPFIDALWLIRSRRRGIRHSLSALPWLLPLRRKRFDLTVDLYASRHTARLARLSGARYRTGRNRPETARAYNLLPPPESRIYESGPLPDLAGAVARNLGAEIGSCYLPLALSPENRRQAEEFLAAIGRQPGVPLALINPGASNRAKTWPSDRFGAVGAALAEAGVLVAALQNPGQEARQAEAVAASRGGVRAAPLFSIRTVCALLECADLLVTGDTGVMHLSMAHGTPAVIVSGPTHPVTIEFSPALQTLFFHRDSCRERDPLLSCRFQRDCAHISCIRSVGADEVIRECLRRLGR